MIFAALLTNRYVWAAGAAVAASIAVAGYIGSVKSTARSEGLKSGRAEIQAQWNEAKIQSAAVAASAAADFRAREQAYVDRIRSAEHEYTTLQTEHARAIVAQRNLLADNGRLRNDIAAFAAGSGSTAPDSIAAASERAARLGGLLAEALRADAESSIDAEANADAVRTILDAWPHDGAIALPALKLRGT